MISTLHKSRTRQCAQPSKIKVITLVRHHCNFSRRSILRSFLKVSHLDRTWLSIQRQNSRFLSQFHRASQNRTVRPLIQSLKKQSWLLNSFSITKSSARRKKATHRTSFGSTLPTTKTPQLASHLAPTASRNSTRGSRTREWAKLTDLLKSMTVRSQLRMTATLWLKVATGTAVLFSVRSKVHLSLSSSWLTTRPRFAFSRVTMPSRRSLQAQRLARLSSGEMLTLTVRWLLLQPPTPGSISSS